MLLAHHQVTADHFLEALVDGTPLVSSPVPSAASPTPLEPANMEEPPPLTPRLAVALFVAAPDDPVEPFMLPLGLRLLLLVPMPACVELLFAPLVLLLLVAAL